MRVDLVFILRSLNLTIAVALGIVLVRGGFWWGGKS